MYKNIVVLDLWTDANRGDESLQTGLIKMLRLRNPEAKITGIFRFGHNEFESSKAEISGTLQHLDNYMGGIRRTSYAGKRANGNAIYKKAHNLFSFIEIALLFLLYKVSGTAFFSKKQELVANTLRSADLVVWKGKNFRPPPGLRGIPRQLTLTIAGFIAGIFSNKIICVNASFWKIDGVINKWLMKNAFLKCFGVTVRDKSSVINAADIISSDRIFYCKDLSYFDIYSRISSGSLNIKKDSFKYALALTITKWGNEAEQKVYIKSISSLIDKTLNEDPSARVVITPQVIRESESSYELINELLSKHNVNLEVIKGPLSINELLEVYSSSKLLVGTRMHSCVFAAAVGTPFVAIAYDFGPKWEILNDLVDDSLVIPLREVNSDKLLACSRSAKLKDFDLKALAYSSVENVAF
jgi:polysaccharide pyruvyl transferase WcaK-like protein